MNTTSIDVPDSVRPYLDEISERIWTERSAVMIGSGFSKNAGNEFPDWNQLGDLLYQKANGLNHTPNTQKYQNILRIAEEVQATIGRPALENYIRLKIPDLQVEPSGLHIKLLELPWTDVFTTNYDTLLERASSKIVSRRYEPVVNKKDIPYASKPRIIKLHGSFPSERPFIITEEDYRRYKIDYAPFVNTVQQALLENTLCLIGFSGDDPNFLNWIGWIRDNLGKDNMQKIFFVGVFDMSLASLKLLEQRGIIVINLSCFNDIESNDHEKALNLFIEYIQSKKPRDLYWPHNLTTQPNLASEFSYENNQKITEQWRKERLDYPGWLILPHDKREKLWLYTQQWINYLPDSNLITDGLDIKYTFELIWRLERCLLPIFDNIAVFCESMIEKYWPFQYGDSSKSYQINHSDPKFEDLPWEEIQQSWLFIALAMLRFYREEGYIVKWKETELLLKNLSKHLTSDQKEFLNYEGFLFNIFTLDLPNAKKILDDWKPIDSQPYWRIKLASGFAEIGLVGKAYTIAENALKDIRKKLNHESGSRNISLSSLESYAMLVTSYIQMRLALLNQNTVIPQNEMIHFYDRWNELKGFMCDPRIEIKLLTLALKNPIGQTKDVIKKRTFDIGHTTTISHVNNVDKDSFNSYSFLRFCEEVGLPYRIGNFNIVADSAIKSMEQISRYSMFWAIVTLIRSGDNRDVNSIMNRKTIYKFTLQESDQLIDSYIDAINRCWDDISKGNQLLKDTYGVRFAQLVPEVISRLCSKSSDTSKYRIFDFIIQVYTSPDFNKFDKMDLLTRRFLGSLSHNERYRLIPDLLEIPLPNNLNKINENKLHSPLLYLKLNKKPELEPIITIPEERISILFQQAISDDHKQRNWSITSLIVLHQLNLLNEKQNNDFSNILWNTTDNFGLPIINDYNKSISLILPHPVGVDPIKSFKDYIVKTPLPVQPAQELNEPLRINLTITMGNIPIVDDIIFASHNIDGLWTKSEITKIFARLVEWWDADKEYLRRTEKNISGFPPIQDDFKYRFNRLIALLAEVVIPHLSARSKKKLDKLLREIREYGLHSLTAEASSLHLFPDHKKIVYNRINDALISNQHDIKENALNAILIIIKYNSLENNLDPELEFILCQYLQWCPLISIKEALLVVTQIVYNYPTYYISDLEIATLNRLERLLSDSDYDNCRIEMDFDEKLEIRSISSQLAASLFDYYSISNQPIPNTIDKWRKACMLTEEFSEIQNPWRNCKANSELLI